VTTADTEKRRKELARRKRERIIIVVLLLLVTCLTYVETQVVVMPDDLPMGSSIMVFALININALLLLLVIFLFFRNMVKLLVERRRGVLGARLRTKLVAAFVLLSLAPTAVVFFAAFQFVGTSMEFWFSDQVEQSLFEAMEVTEGYNQQLASNAAHFAEIMAREIPRDGVNLAEPNARLAKFIGDRQELYGLAAVRVFRPGPRELAYATQSGAHISHFQAFPLELVSRCAAVGEPLTHLQAAPTGDFAAAAWPIRRAEKVAGVIVVFRLLPPGALARIDEVRKGLEDYRQLKAVKNPIRTNLYITLSIVTLLIIFAATWFGFQLAATITVPLGQVAQGTQRVAGGDYDFSIDAEGPDEIGTLVNSFNRMTADLKTSKARLDEAQEEMRRANRELDQRRRYMEIILRNVAAGVIAIDAQGVVATFNPSAERLLGAQAEAVLGRHWRQVMDGRLVEMLGRMQQGLLPGARGAVDQQVRVNVMGEALTFMVHLSQLRDDQGRDLGVVVVFEDLTELEKAQRMAAWREVARRIAHEVKNPLTPIKLSAQRLVRRYQGRQEEGDTVFDECTRTIIHQVEELRRLVSEFSTFARLPSAKPAPADPRAIAEEALALFRGGRADIGFELECEGDIPVFELDKEQIGRVLINLLDNAVAALDNSEGPKQVVVRLSYDDILKYVRLEVEDTGCGIAPEDKIRLFEPYFSTKRGGTGLGLSIVSAITADHGGYIRVQDNQPQGARIIIELPARGMRPAKAEQA